MTWEAVAVNPAKITPEFLFDIGRKHKLIPERIVSAIDYYRAIAPTCVVIEVVDTETKDSVADIIISDIIDGESASVDFIPVARFFAPVHQDGSKNEDHFHERLNEAIGPIFRKLLSGRDLRRLTAMVPKSRSRTYKALIACGFRKEGQMRDAIKFRGQEAEDLVILGLLPAKENGDGIS